MKTFVTDATGIVADNLMQTHKLEKGQVHRHETTQRIYVIDRFVWIGESDTWGVLHYDVENADEGFVRSVTNFCGNMINGKPRFVEI